MRYLLSIAFLVIACSVLHAQAQPQSQKVKIDQVDPQNPGNPGVLQFDPANFKKGPQTKDTVRVLIKLKSSSSQSTGRSKASDIESQHQQFYSDLRKLTGASSNQRTSEAQTVVHYEYRETFNGFALTTSGRIAESLKGLPYVAAVLEDKLVKVSSEESNNVIKAQQARQAFGVTGKNIRIGIIDTGIDYNHPDLGQGFGPSFKVVGGYDFVNDDSDPMDDHGHGTHVAGIAAANGVVYKGVAPDAKLVAYKVLSSGGYGYDSWILAAIERTVDPDQNPATDDALDVVNMSLGRTPDANEPMSEAVNNAVSKGVVFCIAAGNSGGYFTVGTPGIAASAITVGATDNYLNTAYFSSKGPTEDLRLKPEVSAPGMDIMSTIPQNGYQSMSGTSMASPHVAGAVALILEKQPDLTAEKIKNLLMTTAQTPLTSSPWEQGTGVIDIYKALSTSASFTVSAGFLNFGLAEATTLNKTQTFLLKNTSNIAQTFNLTSEGILNSSPMSLAVSPAQVTIQAGVEQQVTVTLSSSAEPALQNLPDAYTGRIKISNGTTTTRIESAFMNPQHTDINFDGQLPDLFIVLGIEGSFYWMAYYPRPDGATMRLYLPKAKYDIVTLYDYGQRFLITEGIDTEENANVTLRKTDVKNTIAFKPLNETGEAITIDGSSYVMGTALFNGNNRNIITMFPGFVDTLYISDTEHYGMEFSYNNPVNGKYYDVSAATGWGISASGTYSNDPNKLSKITLMNPSLQPGEKQMTTTFLKIGAPGFWMATWNPYPFELPATFDFYQTQRGPSSGNFGMFFSFKPKSDKPGYVWETYDIRSEEGDQISFNQHVDRKQVTIHKKELVYPFGRTIPVFNMAASHYENLIKHETFFGRGAFIHSFGEHPRGTTAYHLHQNGVTIKKGNIFQSMYTDADSYFEAVSQPLGQYNLDFEYHDFQTGGKFATAKLSTTFNTGNSDKNPPHIKSIRLVSNDEDTNELQASDGAELLLTIQDGCEYCYTSGIKTPTANFKKQDATNWTALTIGSLSANEFKADLPAALEHGYYVLQIKGEDNEGNKFVYEVTPAFYIGEEPVRAPFSTVNLIAPRNNSHPGITPLFEWTAVTADNYTLQISDDLSFENPIELISAENTFSLETPLEENVVYYWRVKPNGSNTSGAWSSIFVFESRILASAELISPEDDADVDYDNVEFSWSTAKDAYAYQLEISTEEDFSILNYAYRTGETELSIYLYPGQQYYWRVKAFFYLGWFEEESVSSVRTVNTNGTSAPILSFPADDSKDVDLSVTFMWSGDPYEYSYRLELSKNEDFTNDLTNVVSSFTVYSTSYVINNLEPETNYFWRVTGLSFFGIQNTSEVFSFTTKSIPPPALVSPVNNAVDVQLATTFVWSVGESDVNYLFELSKNEGFTSIANSATVETNYIVIDNLTPGTNYLWRVTRKIQTGSKKTSEVYRLTTKSISPPTLLFPANNATGVQLATNFSWSSGESGVNYLFELSKKEDFTDVVKSVTVQTISVVVDNLEPGTDYFWRVSQMYGGDKITSAVYRFTSAPVTSTEATGSALNYTVPNPFSTAVEIIIHSTVSQDARINIVDPVGRLVKQIPVQLTIGSNAVSWDAADDQGDLVAQGIYFAFIHRAGQAPCVIRMMRLNR